MGGVSHGVGQDEGIIIRKTKRCAIFKRTAHFFRTKRTSEGDTPFSKNFRLAYASIQQLKRRWNTIPTPFVFRFVASLPLCYFGYRLVGFDALRFLDFSAEGQARPVMRALEADASKYAYADDTPPNEFALL